MKTYYPIHLIGKASSGLCNNKKIRLVEDYEEDPIDIHSEVMIMKHREI